MPDLYELGHEHKEVIESYKKTAKKNPKETLSKAYNFVKQIANMYYIKGKMDANYCSPFYALLDLELKCLGSKNMNKFSKIMDTTKSPEREDVLNNIIWNGRKYLMGAGTEEQEDLYNWFFQYRCVDASNFVNMYCKNVYDNVKSKMLTIYIGYDFSKYIDFDITKHCFNIIEYNNKKYLVDLTLAQFFHSNVNNVERLGIPRLEGPSVGYYLSLTENGRKIASKILTDGYIELDDDIFKTYLDAFTLAFRNGLYYENGDKDFCVPYSIDDYNKFLSGRDSQIKHEKIKCLGKQYRPLKNPNFDFKSISL